MCCSLVSFCICVRSGPANEPQPAVAVPRPERHHRRRRQAIRRGAVTFSAQSSRDRRAPEVAVGQRWR